ncbi:hypothetical protein FQN50_004180 [Emmonsiellopsis sp. PD_5]|nr:hypothetical protein FQN50_004180 [Emmonsiellopsis sp. PD_5]
MAKRLQSMEQLMEEMRAYSISPVRHPDNLNQTSSSFSLDADITYATDLYQAILAAV